MEAMRRFLRPISIVLLPAVVLLVLPARWASAALAGTERVMETGRAYSRGTVLELMQESDVRHGLIARGVDPREVEARIRALSDAELATFAKDIGQAPAGGGIIAAIFIIMVGWMFVDWTGGLDRLFEKNTEEPGAEAED